MSHTPNNHPGTCCPLGKWRSCEVYEFVDVENCSFIGKFYSFWLIYCCIFVENNFVVLTAKFESYSFSSFRTRECVLKRDKKSASPNFWNHSPRWHTFNRFVSSAGLNSSPILSSAGLNSSPVMYHGSASTRVTISWIFKTTTRPNTVSMTVTAWQSSKQISIF